MRKPISLPWLSALASSLVIALYFTTTLRSDDRTLFSPGQMTAGHYQIELACNACHTPFQGVKQDACLECHGAALERSRDSHPRSKFEDPRNADLLAKLDARACVSCHQEHRPDKTRAMGVTLAEDFCVHCHADIGTERRSHTGLPFNGCAASGCHNYHDNTALYEDFLTKHLETDAGSLPRLRPALTPLRTGPDTGPPLALRDADAPAAQRGDAAILKAWAESAHAGGGVNCRDCHQAADKTWATHPNIEQCGECHETAVAGFSAGKHGMRAQQDLPAMRPGLARLPMHTDSLGHELGCTSCHGAHDFDTRRASVEACTSCHADKHTQAYGGSAHFALWEREQRGELPAGSGVSCATCHLPREPLPAARDALRVQHNQNRYLRPNEKLLRPVCLQCHDLAFALDALADRTLIERNFAGQPSTRVQSLDMVRQRIRSTPSSRSTP